jgi:prepilin-type N-terminal cleavage/methylation domain-containing protein
MLVQQNPSGMGEAMRNPQRASSQTSANHYSRQQTGRKPASGFSLLELMIAMGVFLIVGGAAVSLVRRHMPLFNTAQNQTTLNISLRNAVAQLQMEVVNAGTGFAAAAPVAFSPMGATITKAANPNCRATANYIAGCFDQLSLISVDGNLPPLAPSADALGAVAIDTTTTNVIFLTMPGNPAAATPAQYLAWAGSLKAGTELMFVQGGTDVGPAGQPSISIIVLQIDAVPVGNSIQLTTTGATLANVACPNAGNVSGIPAALDPLKLYDIGECGRFTGKFSPGLDYAVKLVAGATYSVDATTPANPKLVRTDPAGKQDIIAEQIIGFTVGAWSSQRVVGGLIAPGYTTNPADYKSDWASVRSIQVQLVARATPNTDNPSTFQNAYDQGTYQVQGMSVVINPRNLNSN